jgi:integrase
MVNANLSLIDIASAAVQGMASAQTRRVYAYRIKEYLSWSGVHFPKQNPTPTRTAIQAWLLSLRESGAQSSTLNQSLSAIKKLCEELTERGLIDYGEASAIRSIKGRVQRGVRVGNWLTPEDALRMIEAGESVRDRAIAAIMIGCGLRRSEVAGLTWENYVQRWGRWVLADIVGKGGRVRTVAVPDWAAERLNDYQRVNPAMAMDYGSRGPLARDASPGAYEPTLLPMGTGERWASVHPMPAETGRETQTPTGTRLLPNQPGTSEVLFEVPGDRCNDYSIETARGGATGYDGTECHGEGLEGRLGGEIGGELNVKVDPMGYAGDEGLHAERNDLYPYRGPTGVHSLRPGSGDGMDGCTETGREPAMPGVCGEDGSEPINGRTPAQANWGEALDGSGSIATRHAKYNRLLEKDKSIFHLTESGVWYVITQLAQKTGLTITPHDLRRTYAALSRDGGADLRQIQAEMGHSSIQTTERYLSAITGLRQGQGAGDHIRLKP